MAARPPGSLPRPLWQCWDVAKGAPTTSGRHRRNDLPEPVHVFPFDFTDITALASRLYGVFPASSGVAVSARELTVRFGPWVLRTPVENIRSARVTRELPVLAAGGPPRVDPRTRGITMATTPHRGVKLQLREPVPGALPTERLRHPEIIVTVRDPEGLVALLDTLHRPG